MSSYVALLADVVASRALAPARRARLQQDLRAAARDWNRRWRGVLAARFAITLGDEVQCLLAGAGPLWEIAHAIRARFAQVDWVVAAGLGAVTTPLTTRITAPEVDGPCFHAARLAMARAKARRLVFAFEGFGAVQSDLDGCASYYSALYWSWTARQRNVAKVLRVTGPAAAARELGIDRSAVSHLARRMAWPLVTAGDTMFRTLLAP
jgi:hypothetical protein